mmetsp:Transcript_28039/g.64467  ORF Transcript_28039/g.64467 Transcript_28039/m.64467 type:complete len:265 (-) Transcript_28039:3203-3997(-)
MDSSSSMEDLDLSRDTPEGDVVVEHGIISDVDCATAERDVVVEEYMLALRSTSTIDMDVLGESRPVVPVSQVRTILERIDAGTAHGDQSAEDEDANSLAQSDVDADCLVDSCLPAPDFSDDATSPWKRNVCRTMDEATSMLSTLNLPADIEYHLPMALSLQDSFGIASLLSHQVESMRKIWLEDIVLRQQVEPLMQVHFVTHLEWLYNCSLLSVEICMPLVVSMQWEMRALEQRLQMSLQGGPWQREKRTHHYLLRERHPCRHC